MCPNCGEDTNLLYISETDIRHCGCFWEGRGKYNIREATDRIDLEYRKNKKSGITNKKLKNFGCNFEGW